MSCQACPLKSQCTTSKTGEPSCDIWGRRRSLPWDIRQILAVSPRYLCAPTSHGEILCPVNQIRIQTVKVEKDLAGPDPGLSDGSCPKHEDSHWSRHQFPSGHRILLCTSAHPRLLLKNVSPVRKYHSQSKRWLEARLLEDLLWKMGLSNTPSILDPIYY